MSLSEYDGHVCFSCDACGVDCNTGVSDDDDLARWLDRHGWSYEFGQGRDCQYFCPGCTRERITD